MRKKFVTLLAGAALLIALVPAAAFADPHDTPPAPGDANCHGQKVAFIVHQAKKLWDVNGFANEAAGRGLTVQELQAFVDAYCAGELP